jgi:hypothetical protein
MASPIARWKQKAKGAARRGNRRAARPRCEGVGASFLARIGSPTASTFAEGRDNGEQITVWGRLRVSMGTLGGSLLSSSGSLAMFTGIRRASSLVSNLAAERCPSSHSYLLRSRRTIELRSYIKPELGKLQVGLARFVHVRVARPFETICLP